jgi:kynureninase
MKKGFVPMQGAAGWQLSNAQVLSMAAHKVSLDMFEKVGMDQLRAKSIKLTNFMEELIEDLNTKGYHFNIITPKTTKDRGAQLSILTGPEGKQLFDFLSENGVICDWREPNVIRVAAVPMYNSFEDAWHFVNLLQSFSN